MSVPFSNTRLRVPKGFETLLEGFAREVLRTQPKSIIQFAVQHFSNLIKIRTETGQDPVDGCVDYEDRFYNNASFKRGAGGSNQTPASETLEVAHSTVDGQSGENAPGPNENDAAVKIQAGYKGYKARKEVKEMKSGQAQNKNGREEPKATENANNDVDIDPNNLELNEAATKIQAGFRGHTVRKRISKTITADTDANNSAIKKDNDIDIDLTDPEVSAAATKIQANFRGHHTRQKLKDTPKEPPSEEAAMSQKSNDGVATCDDATTGDQGQKDDKSINYKDPQVHLAAAKIQAGFKGYQTRKSLKKQAGNSEEAEKDSGS